MTSPAFTSRSRSSRPTTEPKCLVRCSVRTARRALLPLVSMLLRPAWHSGRPRRRPVSPRLDASAVTTAGGRPQGPGHTGQRSPIPRRWSGRPWRQARRCRAATRSPGRDEAVVAVVTVVDQAAPAGLAVDEEHERLAEGLQAAYRGGGCEPGGRTVADRDRGARRAGPAGAGASPGHAVPAVRPVDHAVLPRGQVGEQVELEAERLQVGSGLSGGLRGKPIRGAPDCRAVLRRAREIWRARPGDAFVPPLVRQ